MEKKQLKDSGLLILSNLALNASGFVKQIILAWVLGLSSQIDLLLLAMIVPSIIQSMIGGGAGEIMVIKRDREGFSEGSFETLYIIVCLIPVIIIGCIYYGVLGLVIPFYDIDAASSKMFSGLSLIFIANMLPGTFVSVLRPHLYSKGLYRFFSISTIVSQVVGLIFIIATVRNLGIWSFAWSYLLTSSLNALWFSFRSGLNLKVVFSSAVWKHEISELISLVKKVVSLSAQTLLNHIATFWERSQSVKYLSAGYLSALNYAKTITELPNSVILSSVLTTSYIEQVKLHKVSFEDFSAYTSKTLRLLLNAGFLFQLLMLLLAPPIIILVFRRGRFDNDAVESTLIIYNILTIGFIPRLVMNFFSRTMYITGELRKLLVVILLRVILQVSIITIFIKAFSQAIPVAAVLSYMIMAGMLYGIMIKKMNLPGFRTFIIKITSITALSGGILILHYFTLDFYITKTNLQVFLLSFPFFILAGVVVLFFLKRNKIELSIINKIRRLFWKG